MPRPGGGPSYSLRRSRGPPAKRQDRVVEEKVLTSEPHLDHSLQLAQVRSSWEERSLAGQRVAGRARIDIIDGGAGATPEARPRGASARHARVLDRGAASGASEAFLADVSVSAGAQWKFVCC